MNKMSLRERPTLVLHSESMGPAKRNQARRFPNLGLSFCLRIKHLQPKKVIDPIAPVTLDAGRDEADIPLLVLFDNRRLTPAREAQALPAAAVGHRRTRVNVCRNWQGRWRAAADAGRRGSCWARTCHPEGLPTEIDDESAEAA